MIWHSSFSHKGAVGEDRRGHALGRSCDKEEHHSARKKINWKIIDFAPEHFRKDKIHDQHDHQRVEHAPNIAQHAAAVFFFQISADQILQQRKISDTVLDRAVSMGKSFFQRGKAPFSAKLQFIVA